MLQTDRRTSEESTVFASQDEIMLGVLTAVGRDANTSQRNISREVGVALGLANAYLRRCVHKGLIKIKQVPHRRYAYYLTPRGFAEKTRLTGQFFSASFTFFRRAREQMSELMLECAAKDMRRIAFAGASELAEVGLLCAHQHSLTAVGVIDATYSGKTFAGLPIYTSMLDCERVDAVIVTDLVTPSETFQAIEQQVGRGLVFAPLLLRLNVSQSGR